MLLLFFFFVNYRVCLPFLIPFSGSQNDIFNPHVLRATAKILQSLICLTSILLETTTFVNKIHIPDDVKKGQDEPLLSLGN